MPGLSPAPISSQGNGLGNEVDAWSQRGSGWVIEVLYEERLFSLKENGMRHGFGTHEKKNRLQTLLMFLRTFTLVKIM